MAHGTLYLIDATAFCYRAFYALRGLSTSFGQPTNAIYGFTAMLNKIMKEQIPEYLAVCFDVSRDTFRQKRFSEYKMQRPPMPEGLSAQMPFIKQIIAAYGFPLFEKEGYEADDVIATLTRLAREAGFSTVIVSSDKDILQLVDSRTSVLSPSKEEGVLYDEKAVEARFGVKPALIPDIIALMGDNVDNIPGVPGIGEKTARELISSFGSLEQLMKRRDEVKQEKTRQALGEYTERIQLNKELALLDSNVEVSFDPQALRPGKPDYRELYRIFKHLEFKKLLKGIPLEEEGLKTGEAPAALRPTEDDLQVWRSHKYEIYLSGDAETGVSCFVDGKLYFFPSGSELPAALFSDASIAKAGHDLKRLKVSCARKGIILEGLMFDTMIAAYLLNPSKPEYRLQDLAWDYLGEFAGDLSGADLVAKLKPKLEDELRAKSLYELFARLEMPLVTVLAEMELAGIALDKGVLKDLSGYLEKRLIELIEEIYRISGTQFNINSPKQLREILFERLKLPVLKRSKTGPSTDEEVLHQLSGRHRLPELLLEYRQLTKLKNTYVDTLPGLIDERTGKVHTCFNQAATETGRLSSSNPNLQNLPVKTEVGRKIREAVTASGPANLLLSCDYSQIELRILAHLSKDETLLAAFKSGGDVHRFTAALIYGLSETEVDPRMRESAKRVNFGIIYGLSSFGLSRDLKIPVEEAQHFIDAYFDRYPRVKEYIDAQIEKARQEGFVTTLMGRRRYLPQIHDKNQAVRQLAERQAVNTPIQGSASDLIKLAMVDIHGHLKSKKLESRMVLQVHDELVFDAPEKEISGLLGLVRERMENVLPLEVPVKVDIKKGKNWLKMEEVR
ncbi:MAG: DNA polymerase I [Candidatus Omnitrophica bacterium]|nr:DNA polymerase I [Candidatus Omnitrophota bacterium]